MPQMPLWLPACAAAGRKLLKEAIEYPEAGGYESANPEEYTCTVSIRFCIC